MAVADWLDISVGAKCLEEAIITSAADDGLVTCFVSRFKNKA
jgi:hypothetical protein